MAYIGRDIRTGAFRQLDDISSGFDGSDTTHTMQVNSTNVSVGDVNQILLSLGGVIQKPGTDFTVSGSTLTFTTAPAANTSFFAILLGSDNGGTVTPTDRSVTTTKLAQTISEIKNTGGDIDIDADGGGINFLDGGTQIGALENDSSNFIIKSNVSDKDIIFKGNDGGTEITPMTIDMSAAGAVGIGTTSPVADAKLTISSADTESAIFLERSGSGKFDYAIHNTGGSLIFKGGSNQTTVASLTEFMRVDSVGHVTKPLQSAFLVQPSSDQNNIDTTDWVTLALGTERFDQNADFASNVFTAPVTGRYFLNCYIRLNSVDEAANYYWIKLVTSNRTIYGTLFDLDGLNADPNYWALNVAALADMDASDTVTVEIAQSGGTQQTDIDGTSSHFSGFLAC